MQKFIIAIMCVLGISGAYAANENAATSKEYVDTELATKQPTIPAQGNNVVMTFDSTADDGIGTKQIYDESASYASQEKALVTAATANTAVQMAINGEFECVLYDPDNPTDCWWWNIKSAQRLPAGYTELEYLESTGTQYIDTGLPVRSNTVAEFEYQFIDINSNYVFGQVAGSGSAAMGYRNSSAGIWWFKRNRVEGIGDILKHKVVFSEDGNIYKDGQIIGSRGTFSENLNYTILLFAERNDNSMNTGRVKIYNFIFKEGRNFVRNFIPARQDSTGTPGMYDTVTNTFYTNAGTGTFIAGPVASYIPQNQ